MLITILPVVSGLRVRNVKTKGHVPHDTPINKYQLRRPKLTPHAFPSHYRHTRFHSNNHLLLLLLIRHWLSLRLIAARMRRRHRHGAELASGAGRLLVLRLRGVVLLRRGGRVGVLMLLGSDGRGLVEARRRGRGRRARVLLVLRLRLVLVLVLGRDGGVARHGVLVLLLLGRRHRDGVLRRGDVVLVVVRDRAACGLGLGGRAAARGTVEACGAVAVHGDGVQGEGDDEEDAVRRLVSKMFVSWYANVEGRDSWLTARWLVFASGADGQGGRKKDDDWERTYNSAPPRPAIAARQAKSTEPMV